MQRLPNGSIPLHERRQRNGCAEVQDFGTIPAGFFAAGSGSGMPGGAWRGSMMMGSPGFHPGGMLGIGMSATPPATAATFACSAACAAAVPAFLAASASAFSLHPE